MKYYLEAFQKYAVFTGRSSRSEFWFFQLFTFLVTILLAVIAGVVAAITGAAENVAIWPADLYIFATLIPSIAISVRRLHDIRLSGWWFLLSFVPLFGSVALLVMFCLDSQPGSNQFGPNPKDAVQPAPRADTTLA